MMCFQKPTSYKKVQGSALVFSLLILVVLTILGLSTTMTSSVEMKMVAGLSDRELAFQAAEAALRGGEAYAETIVSAAAFTGANGLYGEDDDEPDPYGTWLSSDSIQYGTTIASVASQPRYRLKIMSVVTDDDKNANVGRYGAAKKQDSTTVIRITSRGVGITGDSAILLRTYYGKKF